MDQGAVSLLFVGALGLALVVRDLRSLKNLAAFFDAAEEVVGQSEDAVHVADDIALMARSVLNPRRARNMAWLAIRGALGRELSAPGLRVLAFAGRWHTHADSRGRREVLRRFVWELTRASFVPGSVLGLWLLWRGAQHWEGTRPWAILAALGLGVRADAR